MGTGKTSSERVNLAQNTKDTLWSESGGHCQNPNCRIDLLGIIERKHIAELAHIIPAGKGGPRGANDRELSDEERAHPGNILVLCPTCHTVIDKAPGDFPTETLRGWKDLSQRARALAHGTPVFRTRSEARPPVEQILRANRTLFELYGPRDDVFDDDRAERWQRHVNDSIIPNNRKLVAILKANANLLDEFERATLQVFEVHARELEERHLHGVWSPGSTRFPAAMADILESESNDNSTVGRTTTQ